MARLVLLSEGYTGKTFELKIEQNTVGRTPDNTIEIPDGSVSSHHGEFLVRGADVVFRDLGSTNGSYVGSQQITEVTLKPGMVLRLGNIDMRFETGDPAAAKAPAKPPANTSVIPAGINKEQLSGGARSSNFNTTEFKKKSNKSTVLFLVIVGVIAIVLIGILLSLVMKSS